MAVSTKTTKFTDTRYRSKMDVHHISINAGNKKGAAEAIGGKLVVDGDTWWIELVTKVNGRSVKRILRSGDIVFRTNGNTRWQVATKSAFNKRFAVIK